MPMLSNISMAWSSIYSIMQTVGNEEMKLSDKLSQWIMLATMNLPMIISSFKTIRQTLVESRAAQDAMNATEAINNALEAENLTQDTLALAQGKLTNLTEAKRNELLTVQNGELTEEAAITALINKAKAENVLKIKNTQEREIYLNQFRNDDDYSIDSNIIGTDIEDMNGGIG